MRAHVSAVSLLLLAAVTEQLGTESSRRLLIRAFTIGIVVAICSPLVQFLFLDPNVRPDTGIYAAEGIVGFFQDQHSFAAFLVLAIGVSAGLAYGNFNTGRRTVASAHAGLALAGAVVLLYTNSRGGLLALAGPILSGGQDWTYPWIRSCPL